MRDIVYFVQAMSNPSAIKIGWCGEKAIAYRVKQLQTGSAFRLKLVGYISGGYALEHKLHEDFAAYRLQGEWFAYNKVVRASVKKLIEQGPRHAGLSKQHIKISPENTQRTGDIVKARNAGETLASIGRRYNLTRERVRQICKLGGAKAASVIVDSRKRTWTCRKCGTTKRLDARHGWFKGRNTCPPCVRKEARERVLIRGRIVAYRRLGGESWLDIRESLTGRRSKSYADIARQAQVYLSHVKARPEVWDLVFPDKRGPSKRSASDDRRIIVLAEPVEGGKSRAA